MKPVVVFSSDIAGLTGGVDDFLKIYRGYFGDKASIAVEVIGWKHQWLEFVKAERSNNLKIMGIHGPVGVGGMRGAGLKEKLLDWLMIGLEDIGKSRGVDKGIYWLLHENVITQNLIDSQWFDRENKEKLIMVENSSIPGSMEKTLSKVKVIKQKRGNVGVMIDLVHLLKEYEGYCYGLGYRDFCRYWARCMEEVKVIIGKEEANPVGFHLPIGIRTDDNLPVEIMGKKEWEQLALVVKTPKVRYLVFENQRRMSDQFIPPRWFGLESIIERNKRILNSLNDWGIIEH
ncbi:MAG: hypothetical protein WC686_02545 [Candidatus Shapirobacteria bacterium]|jgi:hypothetical protein